MLSHLLIFKIRSTFDPLKPLPRLSYSSIFATFQNGTINLRFLLKVFMQSSRCVCEEDCYASKDQFRHRALPDFADRTNIPVH